uniref:Tail protein n=1 Tax=viral metagenome TaxID=1070528 RepID=A0A6M3KNM0_9ZZZZ
MPITGPSFGVKSFSIGGGNAIVVLDEVTPALNALKAQLANKEPILEELAWMAIEHVKDRYLGQGYSRKFGAGPQPKWAPITDVTRKFRRIRSGVTDDIIWFQTGKALQGITVLNRGVNSREIGWPFGQFKNDYPYKVDGGVPKTGGMIPGKRIPPRPLLYFTNAFAERHATRAVWRWWLSPIGVRVFQ